MTNFLLLQSARLRRTSGREACLSPRLPPVKHKKKSKRCFICAKKTGLATSYQCRSVYTEITIIPELCWETTSRVIFKLDIKRSTKDKDVDKTPFTQDAEFHSKMARAKKQCVHTSKQDQRGSFAVVSSTKE